MSAWKDPTDVDWWEFVPVFDGQQQGKSTLRQYERDWGYGVVLGEVAKRYKKPDCSWAVKHALDDWDDVLNSGKPPLAPMSPAEYEGVGERVGGTETEAEADGKTAEESDSEPLTEEEIRAILESSTLTPSSRKSLEQLLRGETLEEPNELLAEAAENYRKGTIERRLVSTAPSPRRILAKGTPTVAEGLAHARGSLGGDPKARLSFAAGGALTPGPSSHEPELPTPDLPPYLDPRPVGSYTSRTGIKGISYPVYKITTGEHAGDFVRREIVGDAIKITKVSESSVAELPSNWRAFGGKQVGTEKVTNEPVYSVDNLVFFVNFRDTPFIIAKKDVKFS